MNKRRLAILAGAVGVAVGAGAAFAIPGGGPVYPDAAGVFHGCVKGAGDVYLVDHAAGQACKTQGSQPERHVHWSQTGPQGSQGPQGPQGEKGDQGDKGDTGEPGPSAAYANYGPGTIAIGDGETKTVASVTVPAGSYVLSGIAHAIDADGSDFLQCSFVAPGTVNGRTQVMTDDGSEPVLADVTVSGAENTIFLRCFALNGTILAQGQMIATQVGSVTASE